MLTLLLLALAIQAAPSQAAVAAPVTITGNVAKPGEYALTEPTTVVKLLSMAGGLKQGAKKDAIRISRAGHARYFDFEDWKIGRNLKQNVQLRPGDRVIVRP